MTDPRTEQEPSKSLDDAGENRRSFHRRLIIVGAILLAVMIVSIVLSVPFIFFYPGFLLVALVLAWWVWSAWKNRFDAL